MAHLPHPCIFFFPLSDRHNFEHFFFSPKGEKGYWRCDHPGEQRWCDYNCWLSLDSGPPDRKDVWNQHSWSHVGKGHHHVHSYSFLGVSLRRQFRPTILSRELPSELYSTGAPKQSVCPGTGIASCWSELAGDSLTCSTHWPLPEVLGAGRVGGFQLFGRTCLGPKKREAIGWQVVYCTCWGRDPASISAAAWNLKAAKERCENQLLFIANSWNLWRAGCQLHHWSESRYPCGSGNLRCCAARSFRDGFGHLVNDIEGQCWVCLRKQCSFPPSCPLHFCLLV